MYNCQIEICKLVKHWSLKITMNRAIDRILFAFLVPVLPGGKTKISGAHLRRNVRFYGSRLTPCVSRHGSEPSLVKPSGGAKPCIDRVFLLHGPHSEGSISKLLWWLFVARSSFARAMLHRARTYVWIITRACGEFAIIANVLSSGHLVYSRMRPAGTQQISHATELRESEGPWIYIRKQLHYSRVLWGY